MANPNFLREGGEELLKALALLDELAHLLQQE